MKIILRPITWPPLLEGRGRLPHWVLLRDALITVLAWAVLAYLLRDIIRLGADFFGYPFFQLTTVSPPDMVLVWARLQPYTEIIALAMVWLLLSVLVLRRKARGRRLRQQAPDLPLEQHAMRFGLDTGAVAAWQKQRVVALHFSSEGRIVSGPGTHPPESQRVNQSPPHS